MSSARSARTREAQHPSPARAATPARSAREHPALNRQRALGNRVVQREGLLVPTLKDIKKHFKDEKDESVEGPSKDAALHAKQAFALLESAFESIRSKRLYADDRAGAEKAAALTKHFKRGGELVAAGEKGFEWIVKVHEYAELLKEVSEAAEALHAVDLTQDGDREKAAQAYDKAFTVLGKLGQKAPKGPWQAYFEFLTHFGDGRGFFTSVSAGLDPERRERDQKTLRELGLVDRKAKPPAALEDRTPVKFDDVEADVDAKIEANLNRLPDRMQQAYVTIAQRSFKEELAKLKDLRRQYHELSWTSRMLNRPLAKELAGQIDTQVQKVIAPLELMRRDFAEPYKVHVSFANDIAALGSAR